jgi:transposase-like protein
MSQSASSRFAGYRFPPEIISHAVCFYLRSSLSLRMIEEMLAARGIIVGHETVRPSLAPCFGLLCLVAGRGFEPLTFRL